MPSGIAVRIKDVELRKFFTGSALFRLYPSLGMSEDEDNHVVVAFSPAAVDHGVRETSIFKCDASGRTARWGGLDGGAEALAPCERIVGRYDVEAALANLGGAGYLEVDVEQLEGLRTLAMAQAAIFCETRLTKTTQDVQDYAANNWGMFAAMYLVQQRQRPAPMQSVNHVFDLR